MITLTELDYNINTYEVAANFDGFLEEGFSMECEIEYDVLELEPIDESVGIKEATYDVQNLTYWYIKFYDELGKEMKVSRKIETECKNEIESLLIDKILGK